MSDLQSFFKGKRVLLTGHTGFKGAWLTLWLKQWGADVMGISLPPSPQHPLLDILETNVPAIYCDLASLDSDLPNQIKAFEPEIVIHMAAQALVIDSYQSPLYTFQANTLGTAFLLECLRSVPSVRSIVVVTSDKCYRNPHDGIPFRESDPLGGEDPYSASKGAAEIVAASYRHSFFLPARVGLASVRSGNVIGGGDWAANRILPDCARALIQDKDIVLRNPWSLRPWQHVFEPLHGYLLVARRLYENPIDSVAAWNFGPEAAEAWSVVDVAKAFCNRWGKGNIICQENYSFHEAPLLRLDASLSQKELGWHCCWNTKTAIQETADWYLAAHNGANMRAWSLAQLERYTNILASSTL